MTEMKRTRPDGFEETMSPWAHRVVEPAGASDGTATASPTSGRVLVLLGAGLWAVAQVLPAYTRPAILGSEPIETLGWVATTMLWSLVPFGGAILIVPWTANIWLAIALFAAWRRHARTAVVSSAAAALCAADGMWILVRGGLPEVSSFATITEVGAGSYLWFAGIVLVLVGTAIPALRTRGILGPDDDAAEPLLRRLA